jgi:hypothetical protein
MDGVWPRLAYMQDPYVLRSRAIDARTASSLDRRHGAQVLSHMLGPDADWRDTRTTESMYHPVHLPMFDAFARTNRVLLNSMVADGSLARYALPDHFRPFRAYTSPSVSDVVLGFDMLNLDATEYRHDYPIPWDENGSHGMFAFYVTYAFMLQHEAFKHVSPHIDLHILTNGVRFARAYDPESKLRFRDPHSRKLASTDGIYVHSENIDAYLNTLFTSSAFLRLIHHRDPTKRLRRIVLPFQSPGHMFLIGWDRYYYYEEATGRTLERDRVFCMSNSPASVHPFDPGYDTNLVTQFADRLLTLGIAHTMPEKVPRVAAADSLRALTFHESLPDFDCCYAAIANTLYLAAVENISDDVQPQFASLEFLHHVRNAYMAYLDRLVNLIQAQHEQRRPILLSAEWGAPFVNIRTVRLLPDNVGYDWNQGFVH